MTMLAAIQMVSSADVDANLATAARLISDAVTRGAQFVALPEYFAQLGAAREALLQIAERDGDGRIQHFLADTAARYGIWLLGGTLPILASGGTHVRNASCLIGPDGALVARYDKMHLFAFDDGQDFYDEATILEAGDVPVVATAAHLRVGLSVCYDVRFPELYRAMQSSNGQAPLDLICVPAAFTHATGRDHWELLLRARAIENQCYVLAPAQGGTHADGRRTWGHSMIIDPWGDVLSTIAEGEGSCMARFDRARLDDVRRRLPALQHRLL